MADFKKSDLLMKLIDSATKLLDGEKQKFTAEAFLVAIFNMLQSNINAQSQELKIVRTIIENSVSDVSSAQASLSEYIYKTKVITHFDEIYIQRRLQSAINNAQNEGLPELTAPVLLMAILENPTERIEKIIDYDLINDFEDDLVDTNDEIKIVFEKNADEAQTPIPKKNEMTSLVSEIKSIRTELQNHIYGQDNAINTFIKGYFQSRLLAMVDKSRKLPLASFLFAGPPGVGKTYLAEKAAKALKIPFKRFDMSEYCDKEAAIEFRGSDAVYKNNKQGNFTSFVSKNPQCIVLLDEIEKAHISIIHLFLQVLDAGRLRDSNTDREISFKDTILIFTTNVGKKLYQDSEDVDLSGISRKVIIDALKKDIDPETGSPYFPPAICSRFASGNVVMFNHIGNHHLRLIAKKKMESRAESLKKEMGISVELDEAVYTALMFSEGVKADARTISSRAEAFFNDELYELFRLILSERARSIENIEKIKIIVDLKNSQSNINELFSSKDKKRALVLADEEITSKYFSENATCDVVSVQSCESALNVIKSQEIDVLLLDVHFGAQSSASENLNIEDEKTPARELMQTLHYQKNTIPIYLLEGQADPINEEEKISFTRQGVCGFLKLTRGNNGFASQFKAMLSDVHQQASMLKLARENKIVTFETSQSISKNGKTATVRLFDFKTVVAVDAEDSKNILSAVSKPDVRFCDVIGADDAKKELMYFVEYLKNPKKYMGTGVKAPKGMLLYGPSGTGKTMLAKAMACEAGVPFIAAEGNQFIGNLAGEGSEKVHELFKIARKYAPSIFFIDEIDAIAKERKGGINAAANGEVTLTSLLTEMDGFANEPSKPVFVLAATNFDVASEGDRILDPALMRRFDRCVYIGLPTKESRAKFLKMKIEKNKALDISEVTLENIAMRSTGMSLASLDSAIELALRSAIRESSTVVTDAILEEAFETFNGGEKRKCDLRYLERIARHEAGHAFLCWLGGVTPSYLTVVARTNHGGYMQYAENEGKAIYTKDELLAKIRIALGGRAAEISYYGEHDGVSTGAKGDLDIATDLAKQIVCSYGMDDDFGLAVVNDTREANVLMSLEIRNKVNSILEEQMNEAISLISANKDKIDSLVNRLLEKNHLNASEISQAITKVY